MPTFLALQCYKCDMMQVKHEKKSSNKWTCSLCNEKQSVRKVYASSMAAKDIRNFVQEYNFSRNSAQDRALAELVLNEEEERNVGFTHDAVDALCGAGHDSLSDECSHPQLTMESKWNEYLCQDEGICTEVLEETTDDANFVTAIPETYARKAKGKLRAAPKNHIEQDQLQQKQRRRIDKFSNRPLENIKECLNATYKENDWPFTSSQKASLLQVPASIQHGLKFSAYEVPQRTVANAPMQASTARGLLGERLLKPQSFKNITSVALRKSKALTDMENPVSRYASAATGLDGERTLMSQSFESIASVALRNSKAVAGVENPVPKYSIYVAETCQEAFATVKQEKHVSKWAKYMDSGEVTSCEEAMQSCRPASKGENVDVGEESRQPQERSNIWSLRATSNLLYFNETELDELMTGPSMSGE